MITALLARPILRFMLVGGTGAVVKLGSMYLFVDHFHWFLYLSYFLSSILAISSNFVLNTFWTFRADTRFTGTGYLSGWLRYCLVSGIAIAINEGILYVLTGRLGVWYLFSTAIGILTAFMVNYLLSRKLVWRGPLTVPSSPSAGEQAP